MLHIKSSSGTNMLIDILSKNHSDPPFIVFPYNSGKTSKQQYKQLLTNLSQKKKVLYWKGGLERNHMLDHLFVVLSHDYTTTNINVNQNNTTKIVRALKTFKNEINEDLRILNQFIKIVENHPEFNVPQHYFHLKNLMINRLQLIESLLESPQLGYKSIPIKSPLTMKNTKKWAWN